MTYRKLQEEYVKKGISLVIARNKQSYYLSLKNVPYTVKGLPEGICQLTGYLTVYSKERVVDIETMSQEVYSQYKKTFENNPLMLSYV